MLEFWPSGFISNTKLHIDYQLEHAESTAQSIEHASLAVYQLGHAEEGLHAQEKTTISVRTTYNTPSTVGFLSECVHLYVCRVCPMAAVVRVDCRAMRCDHLQHIASPQ